MAHLLVKLGVSVKIGICIPWRAQNSRLAAFDVTTRMYAELYPDVKMYLGDQPKAERFNVSAARNLACEAAIADGCDVLVVSDADILPDKDCIDRGVEMVLSGEHLVIGYETARYLSEPATLDVLNGRDFNKDDLEKSGAWVGGLVILSKECFKALNGWDERFLSWGQEDDAFASAYTCIYKKSPARVDAILYTLYHQDRDQSYSEQNLNFVYKYYGDLSTDPIKMTLHILKNRINWD